MLSLCASSQSKTFGLQVGIGNSKLVITEDNNTFFEESSPFTAYYAGIFYKKTQSIGQKSKKNFLSPGIAFELGLDRSGGNFKAKKRNRKGTFYENYHYLNYRMELGVIGQLHYSGFRLFMGPRLYYPLYGTRKMESADKAVYNLKEYEDACLAFSIGLGYEYSIFSFDVRYQSNLTDYGQRFKDNSFEFSERQWRLTAGMRLFKTNREKNNDSIFWE